MGMSEYIGETTAYDKKLMLERKKPLSWLKRVSVCVPMHLADCCCIVHGRHPAIADLL